MRRQVAAALALAMLAVSCRAAPPRSGPGVVPPPASEAATEPAGGAGGTFRWGIQEPDAIVPPRATEPNAVAVVDALFDSLTAWDETSRLVSSAAVGWRSDDSASTWTFALRPDATFHDGTPVTAADFKFAWEQAVRAAEDGTGYHLRYVDGYEALRAGETTGLRGVEALDDRTLQVRLSRPFADFPGLVAHPALGPVPRRAWTDDPAGFADLPVGNGPFRAAEAWAHGRFIRAARFDAWHNGFRADLGVDEVLFQIMDPDSAYIAFQQGRLDFTVVPTGALDDALSRYGASPDGARGPGALLGGTPVLYFLGVNVTRPPFDDLDARRALSLAIDRDAIARDTLEGNLDAARAALPPVIPGARPQTCAACSRDPAAAAQLFSERGIDGLTLWFNSGGGHEVVAEQIQRDLAEVGVNLGFRSVDFAEFLAALDRGEAGLFRFGWTADHPLADDMLYPLFHSDGLANHGGYAAADVDSLLELARATLDEAQRLALYQGAEDLALGRDQAIVPLVTYRHRVVVSDRVTGFFYSPLGRANLPEIRVAAPDGV